MQGTNTVIRTQKTRAPRDGEGFALKQERKLSERERQALRAQQRATKRGA